MPPVRELATKEANFSQIAQIGNHIYREGAKNAKDIKTKGILISFKA
jgi:hypothetical protein